MNTIKIPGYYIAQNEKGQKQVIYYDSTILNEETNETLYSGYYGMHGYHEVITNIKNIKELTDTQKEYINNNQYWKLPQQFYQTFPDY